MVQQQLTTFFELMQNDAIDESDLAMSGRRGKSHRKSGVRNSSVRNSSVRKKRKRRYEDDDDDDEEDRDFIV